MRKIDETENDYTKRLAGMSDREFLHEIKDVHKHTRRKPAYQDAECVVMETLMEMKIHGRL